MSAEALTVQVKLRFSGFDLEVSEDLSLDGVTALFGPNGGGKSTLLRAIAGFETPVHGKITIGDQTWFDSEAGVNTPAHLRPVGFMFQDVRLLGHLSVSGNLDFADNRSRGREAGYSRDDVVAALDLGSLLDRRVAALSGGERQRVALARTLLTRPRLLLLDEPLAALDADRKAEILPYLEQLPKRFGIPTIYVSHAIDEVMQLADRVLVLANGRVRAHGPTGAIVERLDLQPLTGRFEAGVLLDATVKEHDARLSLTHVDLDGETLVMPIVGGLEPGDGIRLRIRARDVALAIQRPEGVSIRNILPGTISEITPEADTAFAEAFVALKGARIRARLTRAAVEDLGLTPGTPVFALIKSVSFDRSTA